MRISVEGLTKRFGQVTAVNRASFTIEEGELFTLLGPSGCGKTTLLRLIAGFYTPDEGEIRFNDRVVNAVPPDERGIGMVFQNYALWPHMTVAQNIGYGLKLRKVRGAELGERTDAILEKVKLGGLNARYPGQLSGGQQQRVARALVLNPKILLLDEPLSNLDAKIRVQLRAEIRKLQKELGITAVYVTHDQEEALTLSDRIAVVNLGSACQIGAPRTLYEQPANRFVADFIGVANLIEGSVAAVDRSRPALEVQTPLGALTARFDENFRPGDACVLSIRPENALLDGEARAGFNRLQGRIAFAAYLGNTIRYDVDVGQGVLFKVDICDSWHHQLHALGSPVSVSFDPASSVAVWPQ
ncbi:MAG: ATP-binding cassette domain-containing protein [Betaproteobacteria bacterium]|nr:ATP-binding cassette domain-containing protein [Betaproteobacteria bacterium]